MTLAGLPLRHERLTPELLPRAAERSGLQARLLKRSIEDVPAIVLPAIVLLKDGDACVLLGRGEGSSKFTAVFPAHSPDVRDVGLEWFKAHGTSYVAYLSRAPDHPELSTRSSDAHWFWGAVRRLWSSWIQIFTAALLINCLGLALPIFSMNVYDRVIPNAAMATLWVLASGIGLALLFDFMLRQLRAVVLDRGGRRVDMAVASEIFEHTLALPLGGRRAAAGVLANQIREYETVRDFFTSASIVALTDMLFIGLFIFVIWILVGPLALVPLLAVPLVIGMTLLVQVPIGRSVARTQAYASRRHAILIESLLGIESIKAAGAEGVMQRKWEDAVAASARAGSSGRLWSSIALNFSGLVQQAVTVVTICWGVILVTRGDITVGGLIATTLLSGRILAPLSSIAATLARAQQARSAMKGLDALMKLPAEGRSGAASGHRPQRASVEFRNVSFSYPEAPQPALANLSFRIEPGERVGIIGRIGSGKTTIGKLVAGFYAPQSGTVLIGGIEARAFEPADLRAFVGYGPQEPELFAGTLRDNVVLGRLYANDEAVARACKIAGVDAFAAGHPLGLRMPVGERGHGLSGGQRQAVALARFLLREPKLLFLDEPSSLMDIATETQFVRELGSWLDPDHTLIVCTHRGAFLQFLNRLIVIENGKLVADGPREQVFEAIKAQARRSMAAPGEVPDATGT